MKPGNPGMTPAPGWYYRLSSFFRLHLGGPVYKIPLDAGFSCPNLNGSIGTGGCTYCHNPAFSPAAANKPDLSIIEQIRRGKKKAGKRYLAYFQAYTGTYAPLDQLERLYREALQDPEIVGISVSTRPDCISEGILALLENLAARHHIWLELGLQSAHNSTLERINRGHTVEQFQEAVLAVNNRGIFICAHVILGLPGENREMMLQTIAFLNRLPLHGVKFHHLQVFKNTVLAKQYLSGEVPVFKTPEEYIPLLCDCLEQLRSDITVHRLAARASGPALLIAPRWKAGPARIAAAVEAELKSRQAWQGFKFRQ